MKSTEPTADILTAMKDRAPSAEFFLQPLFRSGFFVMMTCASVVITIYLVSAMVYDLFHFDLFSDVVPITLMALSVTLVTGAWWTTFKIHKSIHILFENRQIEKLEKGSPLDQVLEKFSALMAVLSFVFFGFMLGLVATFLFLGSKH